MRSSSSLLLLLFHIVFIDATTDPKFPQSADTASLISNYPFTTEVKWNFDALAVTLPNVAPYSSTFGRCAVVARAAAASEMQLASMSQTSTTISIGDASGFDSWTELHFGVLSSNGEHMLLIGKSSTSRWSYRVYSTASGPGSAFSTITVGNTYVPAAWAVDPLNVRVSTAASHHATSTIYMFVDEVVVDAGPTYDKQYVLQKVVLSDTGVATWTTLSATTAAGGSISAMSTLTDGLSTPRAVRRVSSVSFFTTVPTAFARYVELIKVATPPPATSTDPVLTIVVRDMTAVTEQFEFKILVLNLHDMMLYVTPHTYPAGNAYDYQTGVFRNSRLEGVGTFSSAPLMGSLDVGVAATGVWFVTPFHRKQAIQDMEMPKVGGTLMENLEYPRFHGACAVESSGAVEVVGSYGGIVTNPRTHFWTITLNHTAIDQGYLAPVLPNRASYNMRISTMSSSSTGGLTMALTPSGDAGKFQPALCTCNRNGFARLDASGNLLLYPLSRTYDQPYNAFGGASGGGAILRVFMMSANGKRIVFADTTTTTGQLRVAWDSGVLEISPPDYTEETAHTLSPAASNGFFQWHAEVSPGRFVVGYTESASGHVFLSVFDVPGAAAAESITQTVLSKYGSVGGVGQMAMDMGVLAAPVELSGVRLNLAGVVYVATYSGGANPHLFLVDSSNGIWVIEMAATPTIQRLTSGSTLGELVGRTGRYILLGKTGNVCDEFENCASVTTNRLYDMATRTLGLEATIDTPSMAATSPLAFGTNQAFPPPFVDPVSRNESASFFLAEQSASPSYALLYRVADAAISSGMLTSSAPLTTPAGTTAAPTTSGPIAFPKTAHSITAYADYSLDSGIRYNGDSIAVTLPNVSPYSTTFGRCAFLTLGKRNTAGVIEAGHKMQLASVSQSTTVLDVGAANGYDTIYTLSAAMVSQNGQHLFVMGSSGSHDVPVYKVFSSSGAAGTPFTTTTVPLTPVPADWRNGNEVSADALALDVTTSTIYAIFHISPSFYQAALMRGVLDDATGGVTWTQLSRTDLATNGVDGSGFPIRNAVAASSIMNSGTIGVGVPLRMLTFSNPEPNPSSDADNNVYGLKVAIDAASSSGKKLLTGWLQDRSYPTAYYNRMFAIDLSDDMFYATGMYDAANGDDEMYQSSIFGDSRPLGSGTRRGAALVGNPLSGGVLLTDPFTRRATNILMNLPVLDGSTPFSNYQGTCDVDGTVTYLGSSPNTDPVKVNLLTFTIDTAALDALLPSLVAPNSLTYDMHLETVRLGMVPSDSMGSPFGSFGPDLTRAQFITASCTPGIGGCSGRQGMFRIVPTLTQSAYHLTRHPVTVGLTAPFLINETYVGSNAGGDLLVAGTVPTNLTAVMLSASGSRVLYMHTASATVAKVGWVAGFDPAVNVGPCTSACNEPDVTLMPTPATSARFWRTGSLGTGGTSGSLVHALGYTATAGNRVLVRYDIPGPTPPQTVTQHLLSAVTGGTSALSLVANDPAVALSGINLDLSADSGVAVYKASNPPLIYFVDPAAGIFVVSSSGSTTIQRLSSSPPGTLVSSTGLYMMIRSVDGLTYSMYNMLTKTALPPMSVGNTILSRPTVALHGDASPPVFEDAAGTVVFDMFSTSATDPTAFGLYRLANNLIAGQTGTTAVPAATSADAAETFPPGGPTTAAPTTAPPTTVGWTTVAGTPSAIGAIDAYEATGGVATIQGGATHNLAVSVNIPAIAPPVNPITFTNDGTPGETTLIFQLQDSTNAADLTTPASAFSLVGRFDNLVIEGSGATLNLQQLLDTSALTGPGLDLTIQNLNIDTGTLTVDTTKIKRVNLVNCNFVITFS